MIELDRSDGMSIWLRCDQGGLNQLLETFRSALRGEIPHLDARVDMSTMTLKRKSRVRDASIRLQIGNETQLTRCEDDISWLISREDLESGLGRLERSAVEGFFSPAEFMRIQVRKNRKLDYLYCEIVQ